MSTFLSHGRPQRSVRPMLAGTSLLLSIPLLLCCSSAALAADSARAGLTAAQVVEKHVAARGGRQAWQAVQALSMSGKMEVGAGDSLARSLRVTRGPRPKAKTPSVDAPASTDQAQASKQVQLPFTLAMQRPRKSRLEIEFAGKTAVQVYDGASGWKLRPYLNRNDVETFSADETKAEADKADMDGPLLDYAAQGTKVALAGVEPVEGHDAYKLKLTTKAGSVQHIWIDTHSFLDVKVEGIPRRMDGKMRNVWVYQRDFRSVQGLMIPFVLETAVDGYQPNHKAIVDKVTVNPKLDEATFAKPKAKA